MKTLIQIFIWIAHGILYIFRDFTFVNINYEIGHLQASKGSRFELYNYTHSFIEQFISGMNVAELTNLKWILTLVFSVLFCFLTILLLRSILNDWKEAFKLSVLFYTTILVFSALLYLMFGYAVSRELMIIPQSPIASIILFIGLNIFKKEVRHGLRSIHFYLR